MAYRISFARRAARDLDQAEPARAEWFQAVGGAELRDLDVRERGRPHHRGAFGHRDFLTIDGERHGLGAMSRRCAQIVFDNGLHGYPRDEFSAGRRRRTQA